MESYKVTNIEGRKVTFADGQEIEFDFDIENLTPEEWEDIYEKTRNIKGSLDSIRGINSDT